MINLLLFTTDCHQKTIAFLTKDTHKNFPP